MIIKLKNIKASYDDNIVLKDVNCEISKNKITAIIGPSGCGKTTILMILAGLARHIKGFNMKGQINYLGEEYTHKNIEKLIGKTGYVFQQPLAFPLSIIKNLTFATKYLGMSKSECNTIAINKLKEVNLYDEVKHQLNLKGSKLSGGQQQRLCIARALTTNPKVLLLDEPCSALDVKNTSIIEDLLVELKKRYTIILVTHNLAQAKRVSDETIFFNNGYLVESGLTHTVFSNPVKQATKDYINGQYG